VVIDLFHKQRIGVDANDVILFGREHGHDWSTELTQAHNRDFHSGPLASAMPVKAALGAQTIPAPEAADTAKIGHFQRFESPEAGFQTAKNLIPKGLRILVVLVRPRS
jgi:hypothetical protein